MKKTTAEAIKQVLLACSGELAGAADLVREGADPDEAKAYRRAVGHVMWSIYEELMIPLYREHPDIIPDEERDSVEKDLRRRGFPGSGDSA